MWRSPALRCSPLVIADVREVMLVCMACTALVISCWLSDLAASAVVTVVFKLSTAAIIGSETCCLTVCVCVCVCVCVHVCVCE